MTCFARLAAQHVRARALWHAVDFGARSAVLTRARGATATSIWRRALTGRQNKANVAVAVARDLLGELVQRYVSRAQPQQDAYGNA